MIYGKKLNRHWLLLRNKFRSQRRKEYIYMNYRIFFSITGILCASLLSGCAVLDMPKKIWGSSTLTLDRARVHALSAVFSCNFNDCFDSVLTLDRQNTQLTPKTRKFFDVFLQNRRKGVLVVIGIAGNIDTTEVGIFLVPSADGQTTVQISSLSSTAKRKVAGAVFNELRQQFQQIRK